MIEAMNDLRDAVRNLFLVVCHELHIDRLVEMLAAVMRYTNHDYNNLDLYPTVTHVIPTCT